MRIVLAANVLISALLSPTGSPAQLLLAWTDGRFELIVSPALLAELRRALRYPKVASRVSTAHADAFVAWLARSAELVSDPLGPPRIRSSDPGDDYLLALAIERNATLVTGDRHLLELAGDLPIHEPRGFLDLLAERE